MATAESRAAVIWEGDLEQGEGQLELASGASGRMPVSWAARTEGAESKTSPEELIAAAHASCYSMALAKELAEDDNPPEELTVGATCTFDSDELKITKVELTVRWRVPDIKEKAFKKAADKAKENCPVSVALEGNVEISVDVTLEETDDD